MDGAVDLGACQSQRILIDEDAVRNRVSMWVGGGGSVRAAQERMLSWALLHPLLAPHPISPFFPLPCLKLMSLICLFSDAHENRN